MTDTELGDKAEYYRKLSQHNYEIYQETGIRKYYRSYIRYEEISDAFSRALSAADDRNNAAMLRSVICDLASRAEKLYTGQWEGREAEDILKALIDQAEWKAGYNRKAVFNDGGKSDVD